MMHSLLGEKGFRGGMDLYFQRHTGQAVTCEDFICAMEDANQVQWQTFRHWYQQAGTPKVKVTQKIIDNIIELTLLQSCPATPGQDRKPAFMIPVRLGFISDHGEPIQFRISKDTPWQTEALISLMSPQETWHFEYRSTTEQAMSVKNIIPSLFRQFSAPIKLEYNYSSNQLATLFASDSDSFNRWDAGQKLMQLALNCQQETETQQQFSIIVDACRLVLNDTKLDPALKSLAVQLPNLSELINHCKNIDLLFANHQALKKQLANQLKQQWLSIYQSLSNKETTAADRKLQNIALSYLCLADESFIQQAFNQQQSADNMTNEVAALQIICRSEHPLKQQAIQCFYDKWKQQDLVLDKWFSAQVAINKESVFDVIDDLLKHPDFSINNPNRVRSVIASFVAGNLQQFHSLTGKGYQVLVDAIVRLNSINPQIGSRFAKQFGNWKQLDSQRQALISEHLGNIMEIPELTPDILEVVDKSLNN